MKEKKENVLCAQRFDEINWKLCSRCNFLVLYCAVDVFDGIYFSKFGINKE